MDRAFSISGRRRVLSQLSRDFIGFSRSTFGGGSQYRGNIWKNKRDGSPATLVKTGKLRDSIAVTVNRDNYSVITVGSKYGAYQFFGNKNLPSRRFAPIESGGSINSFRLNYIADKELTYNITKYFSNISSGILPKDYANPRSSYATGNPFSPAS
jgi:phage gpG-like protein